jgi:hypothetical protein
VSGDPIVILAGEAMTRLVRAAAKLGTAPLGRYAIIGGVAVSARLRQAHRATADLDAVVDDTTPPPAIETLLNLPGARSDHTGTHRVLIDGIKVEVQGTEPFAAHDLDGLTDKQILYVGAHRYALETATLVTLVAQTDRTRATVPVATPGALIAMKLHAIEDRRSLGGLDKRASDAWDMYRILLDLDAAGSVRDELAALPSALRRVVHSAGERIFVERVVRTIGWMKFGDDRMAAITAEELVALGQPLIDALSSAT